MRVVTANVLEELRDEKYPIVVWGAGSLAIEVSDILKENDVKVECFFYTEEKYKSPIGLEVTGTILPLEEVVKKYYEFAVVMGQGHYEKYRELEKLKSVRAIYLIANPFRIYHGPNKEWIEYHTAEIQDAQRNLDDQESIDNLDRFLKVRAQNDIKYMLDYDKYTEDYIDPIIGYLPEFATMVDAGAYRGDTIEIFMKRYKRNFEEIYAIEPDIDSFSILLGKYGADNRFHLLQYGLSDEHGELFIRHSGSQSNQILESESDETDKVEVYTIDELFSDKKVDLIKIDTPQFTAKILKGGENYIRKNKPCLVINASVDNSAYAPELINWVKKMNMGYRIQLRFDFLMSTRLWLYAF